MPTNEQPNLAGPDRPLGSPEIPQFYLPAGGSKGVYAPRLYGAALVQFAARRRKFKMGRRAPARHRPYRERRTDRRLGNGTRDEGCAGRSPERSARQSGLPAAAARRDGAEDVHALGEDFDRWLTRTQRVEATTKADPPETVSLGPKRGGVSVDLIAIVWELT